MRVGGGYRVTGSKPRPADGDASILGVDNPPKVSLSGGFERPVKWGRRFCQGRGATFDLVWARKLPRQHPARCFGLVYWVGHDVAHVRLTARMLI
jgi:hypothetical protein